MLSYTDVRKLAEKANVIPVYKSIPADLDTPVSAYLKLAAKRRESFLLESIEGGEKLARYSFIGFDPFLVVEGTEDSVLLRQGRRRRRLSVDPLAFLSELFSFYRPAAVQQLPRFTGGGVGYFSYDIVRLLERLPDSNEETIGWPLMRFGLYQHLVVFDHLKQEILLIANILHEPGEKGLKRKYAEANDWIEQSESRLRRSVRRPTESRATRARLVPHLDSRRFSAMVRKAKRYIKEGDIFQVVLSQRWHVDSDRRALEVYRRLRRINPSPHMFLIRFGERAVIGASPEMLARIEKGTIETRPIAGTRPRGKDEAEDRKQIKDLLADPKELAEHTMLLDLGRNDVGHVSRPGSVAVAQKMAVEKYSHVIHLVSSVTGSLQRRVSALDGHFACFPAGTVSGAPKIRAMEIIDELEEERRGVYAGSIAYLDFWGNLDSCIAIRTIAKDGRRYYVQAGAGIVADSRPMREFRETEAKARALTQAIVGD